MGGRMRWSVGGTVLLTAALLGFLLSGCGGSPPAPARATVPRLAGSSVEEAVKALEERGLAAGSVLEEHSDALAEGTVIRTEPPEGEELESGSTVDLVVSKGPETVAVPDLSGRPESEALALLQNLGLQPQVQRIYSESVSAGLVCSSDPAPGSPVRKGTPVTLTVSLGSAYVTCSTCRGRGTVTVTETCPECGGTGRCYT